MKKMVFIPTICIACILQCVAQDNELISQLQVKYYSGELLNLVKTECLVKHIPVASDDATRLIDDPVARTKYLLQFQQQTSSNFIKTLPTEFIFTIDKYKLMNFGDDALNRFKTGSAGKYIDNLLAPVLSGGIQSFLKDTIQAFFKVSQIQLNNLISMASATFLRTSSDITKFSDAELRTKVEQLFNSNISPSLHKMVEEEISNKLIYYKKHSNELILNSVRRFSVVQKSFDDLEGKLDIAAQVTFSNLGKAIKDLADNEDLVNNYINAIQGDIQTRSKKIHDLESAIGRLAIAGQASAGKLAEKELEHAKLVAQNVFQTDVINNYLRNGLSIIGKVEDIKKKAETFFSADYLQSFKKQLDGFKTPTLSGVVNFASTTTGAVEQMSASMQSLGILKGGAAHTVGKFVKYANLAIGLATSLMPPNPIGIISALGSLGGLFGGGGPSLEEQMFEAMNNGFKQLNQRLDQIEEKLDRLTDFVQYMHKDIMQSLNAISSQLTVLLEKIDLQNQMTNYLLYSNYNLVEQMINNNIDETDHGLEYYDRWYNTNTANNMLALQALDVFVSSPDNLEKVVRENFTAIGSPQSIKQIAAYDIRAYTKTMALFNIFNPQIDQDNKAKNLLLLPAKQNTFFTTSEGSELVPNTTYYNFETATENYINPFFLSKIATQYIALHPFFIIYKRDDVNYNPVKTLQELVDMQLIIHDRLSADQKKLGYLLDVINQSLVQQSIFAGYSMMQNMNSAFYQNGVGKQESIDALNANELLAKNFCCFLVNAKIDRDDLLTFSSLYYDVLADRSKLAALNGLLKYGDGRLHFAFNDSNANDPLLYLNLVDPATSAILVRMPVPDLNIIENQRMQYSDSYYGLLQAKEAIVNETVDIGFFRTLPSSQQGQYKSILLMNTNKN